MRGVTLIEVLVVLSMLGIIMMAMAPHLRSGHQAWEIVGDRHADVLQNARIGLDKMTREIMQAQSISDVGSNYIELVDSNGDDLAFQINAQYLECGVPGSLEILAGPVNSLGLTYFEEDGVTETKTLGDIRSVLIQLSIFDSAGKVNPVALSSRALVRKDVVDEGKTIVINEIMYNPSLSPDNNWEWIELHNCSSSDINVNGWKFDNKNIGRTSTWIILAGEYATITKRNSTAYYLSFLLPPNVTKLYVNGNMNMNNNSDTIAIWNNLGESVDSVSYDDSWGGDGNGKSLERIDPQGDSNDSGNWEEGANSSPGAAN